MRSVLLFRSRSKRWGGFGALWNELWSRLYSTAKLLQLPRRSVLEPSYQDQGVDMSGVESDCLGRTFDITGLTVITLKERGGGER